MCTPDRCTGLAAKVHDWEGSGHLDASVFVGRQLDVQWDQATHRTGLGCWASPNTTTPYATPLSHMSLVGSVNDQGFVYTYNSTFEWFKMLIQGAVKVIFPGFFTIFTWTVSEICDHVISPWMSKIRELSNIEWKDM
jgi:hypothetical protein